MDLSPQFDPYSAHALRVSEEFHTLEGRAYTRDHAQHGPNPVFQEHGWGHNQAPCANAACGRYNEEYDNRLMDAQDSKIKETRTIMPAQIAPQLHPLEAVVDHARVAQYSRSEPAKKSPPVMAELPGFPGLHVLDGHHRLLGSQQAQRPITVHVKSG